MKFLIALSTAVLLVLRTAAAAEECPVPDSLLASDSDLTRVMNAVKDQHRLAITVIGTGSSALPGPSARFAYPQRLAEALRQRLPGNDITVMVHVQPRQTTADMLAHLKDILAADKPVLVVWQAGTFDAVSGVEPDAFRDSLDTGVDLIVGAGADVDLMNMQYSPRTDPMLNVSTYADIMRWVAQQHDAVLFDRLAIMRYWNDEGIFDLYAATSNYDMARHVHDCVGQALATQIIGAAHLDDAAKMQTTR